MFSFLPCELLHTKFYINWKHLYYNIPKCIPMKMEFSKKRPSKHSSLPNSPMKQEQEDLASCPFLWVNEETANWLP